MTSTAPFEPGVDGIYADLPQDVYRKAPGLAHTEMKHLDPPARYPVYLKSQDDPDNKREKWELMLGSLVHQRILEPLKPLRQLVLAPEKDEDGDDWAYRKKKNRAIRDSYWAAGQLLVNREEMDQIDGVVESILGNKQASEWLADAQCELSVFSTCSDGIGEKVMRKARPDIIPAGWDCIVDIKTTQDGCAEQSEWEKTLFNFGYWTQAPWHMDVWNEQCDEGNRRTQFAHIVCEKKPPFLVNVFFMDKADIELGRRVNAHRLSRYLECKAFNQWPGYTEEVKKASIPAWARQAIEKELNR